MLEARWYNCCINFKVIYYYFAFQNTIIVKIKLIIFCLHVTHVLDFYKTYLVFFRFLNVLVLMLSSCGDVAESSSCVISAFLLECAVFCMPSEWCCLFSTVSSQTMIVHSLEIASARMLFFPLMWTKCDIVLLKQHCPSVQFSYLHASG